LQFAPNFTAYVLPPDVVCLYSEDRKFFLHGELYCALAAAIGAHVVATFYHQWVLHDGLLWRMWPGRATQGGRQRAAA